MVFFKKEIVLQLLLVVFILIFLGSAFGTSPFYGDLNVIDDGQFGAWAQHMLSGKLMYKDIYITYGPFYVYPLYILFKLFGMSAFLIRFLYLTVSSFIAILIALLFLRQLVTSRILQWIGVFLLAFLPGATIRQAMGLLVLFVIYQFQKTNQLLWCFLGGILTTVSFLISPETGVLAFCISLGFLSWFFLHGKSVFVFVHFIFGIFIAAAIFGIWANHEGWLSDYIWGTFDVFQTFSGISLPNGQGLPNPFSNPTILSLLRFAVSKDGFLYSISYIYAISLFYVGIRFVQGICKREDILIAALSLFGLGTYALLVGRAGNFYLTLTPLIIVYVYFTEKLYFYYRKNKKDLFGRVFAIFGIVLIIVFFLRVFIIYRPHFSKIPTAISSVRFEKSNPKYLGDITISDDQKNYITSIQKYIEKNTSSKDTIFIVTNEPMMYMLTNRNNPTRYDLPYIANTKDKRIEIVADLIQHKPKYILEDTASWAVDEVSNKKRLPEVFELIRKNYKKVDTINKVNFYVRKDL